MYYENYEYGDWSTDYEDYYVPLHINYKGGWSTPYTW